MLSIEYVLSNVWERWWYTMNLRPLGWTGPRIRLALLAQVGFGTYFHLVDDLVSYMVAACRFVFGLIVLSIV
jgi:hypothetical protein